MFLLVLILVEGCKSLPESDFMPNKPHIRVVTYNVNWGFVNPKNVSDYLTKSDADIISLQETHSHWETFLKQQLVDKYRHSVFKDWGGAGGIAIISKYKLDNIRFIDPNRGWFPALLAQVQTPIGTIQLLNVHLRPPLSDDGSARVSALYTTPGIHLKEIQEFMDYVDADKPLVITGDFNEDKYGAAVQWLIEQNCHDALSIYDTYSKTWNWPLFGGLELKNRYDHIIFSKQLSCTAARVDSVDASDHMPVFAVIISQQ